MKTKSKKQLFHAAMLTGVIGLAGIQTTEARVTKIVIDEVTPMAKAANEKPVAIAYETIAGRAFGELDPKLPQNALIQDIELAKDQDGKVRYVASFVIHKPVDLKNASGLMWHDVPNRGRVYPFHRGNRSSVIFFLQAHGRVITVATHVCDPSIQLKQVSFLRCRLRVNRMVIPLQARYSDVSSIAREKLRNL